MGTLGMVDPTALHASGRPATRLQRAYGRHVHVMSWAWSAAWGAEPGGVVLVCAPGVVGMS